MVKISGKNLGGLVYTHSQTSINPDYNELLPGRMQLLKMVDRVR